VPGRGCTVGLDADYDDGGRSWSGRGELCVCAVVGRVSRKRLKFLYSAAREVSRWKRLERGSEDG